MGSSSRSLEESYEVFCSGLKDLAPLPWSIAGGFIVDANGHGLLGCTLSDREAAGRVLNAVITGVATCGGYRIEVDEESGKLIMLPQ